VPANAIVVGIGHARLQPAYLIHRIISGTSSAVIKPFKPMASPEKGPVNELT